VGADHITTSIPIVSFMLTDDVRLGLVANDGRPGSNVTGLSMRLDGMVGNDHEFDLGWKLYCE